MSGTAAVVGGGITGVAAALWLARAGWRVTLIERGAPGEAQQASYGNAGLLARAAVVPLSTPGVVWTLPRLLLDPDGPLFLKWSYLPKMIPWGIAFLAQGREDRVKRIAAALAGLVGDSVDQHEALALGTGAERFIRRGEVLYLYRDRAAYRRDGWGHALKKAHGFAAEERDIAAIRAADPALGPGIGHAVAYPDHGWITDPGDYLAALGRAFEAHGGTLLKAEAAAVAPGRVTLTGGGEVLADRIVLAAGVWSRRLAEGLGLRVPMESERGYHLMLKGASSLPPSPCAVPACRFVATPMDKGLRLAGVVEFGGLEAPPSDGPAALLRRAVRKVWPALTWEEEEVWMGHRPSTIDSLPLLGEVPGAPGVICAFGGQHVGLTIGPRLGRMAAAIARGETPNADLSALAPGRFGR